MTQLVVISSRGEERLAAGHPWIYRSDVVEASAAAGDRVTVRNHRGRVLGHALYSDHSQIALRLLTSGEAPADDALIEREAHRPAPEHGIPRVLKQVDDHLLELNLVRDNGPHERTRLDRDLQSRPGDPLEHRRHILKQRCELEPSRLRVFVVGSGAELLSDDARRARGLFQ